MISREYTEAAALIIAVKLGIFVLGAVVSDAGAAMWQQWDAHWYLLIAESGYQSEGDARNAIAFFPLYPLATALIARVAGNYFWAALVLANAAAIAGLLLFYRLARLELAPRAARMALLTLLLFPTAYFFNAPYTESFFLLVSVGSFYAARRGWWVWAGALGALAALTRVTGVLLLPALAVEFYLQRREAGKPLISPTAWPLLLIGLGFSVYLTLNYLVLGDPFGFLDVQREKWYRSFAWPGQALAARWRDIGWPPWTEYNVMQGIAEFSAGALLILSMIWAVVRLRWSYAVYVTLVTAAILSSSWIMSTPRLMLGAWPIFFLFGQALSTRRAAAVAWLSISVLLLIIFTRRYVLGQWAF